MNRWRKRSGVLSVAAAILIAAMTSSLTAQETEDFRWQGNLAEGKTLEINGLNGNIKARPAGGRAAVVTAVKEAREKARGADLARVEIEVVEHAGGVRICALYPDDDGGCGEDGGRRAEDGNHENDDEDSDVIVDFTVQVPATIGAGGGILELETVNGSIEIVRG